MPCSPSLLKFLTCVFSFCFIVSLCVFICWTVFHFFSEFTDSIVKFLKLFIPKWDVISSSASGYSFCGCSEDCCCKQFYLVVQMLLTQVQIFAVLICFCLELCPVCFLVVPAWTLRYVCGFRVLLDVEDYRFVVTSSKLLFHVVLCDLGHIVCCNGKIWAACCSPCSRVVCVWVIRMVYEHHLVCYDPVFHFFSLRIMIWIAPTGRVAVEVAHYDPSFSIRLNIMETECGGEYRL